MAGLMLLSCLSVNAQRTTTEQYIEMYKDIAMADMREYKIPASITLAQGILESGSGNSSLAVKANNHFGIKCHNDWKGKTYHQDDDEKDECFRSYKKAEDSYRDHSLFLTRGSRYAFLFDLKITDYKGWAKGLKTAGYATNPKYPELLINLIEKYNLNQYDDMVINGDKTVKHKEEKKKKLAPIPEGIYTNETEYKPLYVAASGRQVLENNRIPIIIAEGGETPFSVAQEFHIYARQIWTYNDVNKNYVFGKGEIIYLERKKGKSKEFKYHTMQKDQTMREVSQIYGVRINKLCKLNDCQPTTVFAEGTNIRIR